MREIRLTIGRHRTRDRTVSSTYTWREQATTDNTPYLLSIILIFSHVLILRWTYILSRTGTNHVSPFNVEHIHLTITYSGNMEILMQNIPSNVRYTFPRIRLREWRHDAGGMHIRIRIGTQMRWAIAKCNAIDNAF